MAKLCEDYAARIKHFLPLEIAEMKEDKIRRYSTRGPRRRAGSKRKVLDLGTTREIPRATYDLGSSPPQFCDRRLCRSLGGGEEASRPAMVVIAPDVHARTRSVVGVGAALPCALHHSPSAIFEVIPTLLTVAAVYGRRHCRRIRHPSPLGEGWVRVSRFCRIL